MQYTGTTVKIAPRKMTMTAIDMGDAGVKENALEQTTRPRASSMH